MTYVVRPPPNQLLLGCTGIAMTAAYTAAYVVAMHCFIQTQSTTPGAVGQAFGSLVSQTDLQ